MSSENCLTRMVIPACFVPTDPLEKEIPLNKFITIGVDTSNSVANSYIYVLASDPTMTPITDLTVINGLSGNVIDRVCVDRNNVSYHTEVYRLDGDVTGTATPEIPVHSNNATLTPAVVGNTVTISGARRSISWFFRKNTTAGGVLTINSLDYSAGSGSEYNESGHSEFITDEDSQFDYEKTFTAQSGAVVEIHVQVEN